MNGNSELMYHEEESVSAVCDSIETKLWLTRAYFQQGAEELAMECLRSAWHMYHRFAEILKAYTGSEDLERKLREEWSRFEADEPCVLQLAA